MTERETLKQWLSESENIVFFGGAGVSTESKIPDFRSTDGLYNQQYAYPPETILSHTFYMRRPEEFYRFYRNKMLIPRCGAQRPTRPGKAGAGGKAPGSDPPRISTAPSEGREPGGAGAARLVLRNYCTKCGKFYGLEAVLESEGVPRCTCGGVIKPDVVLYEEGLDQHTLQKAVYYISNADVLIIGGTSLTVYPAAGLIDYYGGKKLVLINKSVTPMDSRADLVISGPIGEILGDAAGV